jgi:hypothetical protein
MVSSLSFRVLLAMNENVFPDLCVSYLP